MRLEIINNKLNSNINKKICIISDIHYYYDYNNTLLNLIIENINRNKPNYICIPGDLVDRPEVVNNPMINNFYKFIERLGHICPVLISVGNHDINNKHHYVLNNKLWDQLNSIKNVYVLNNGIKEYNNIRFIGYTQSYKTIYDEVGKKDVVISDLSRLLAKIDDKKYNVLLAHDPLYISNYYAQVKNYNKVNLMISGHTHGGMLPSWIKGNTALISPCKRLLVKNSRGYFKKGNTDIIVSSGIIKLSHEAGIFHLFNFVYPSSINYIELKRNV